ncbi:MAG: hypothetical protein HN707_12100 [Verrucomicrobia bacterium]|nr:hypothetical protein [Verrucomicrobiota bacterium]MBT6790021.1 hypothetical protein [Verrucomicrobiota bacterium]MBT7735638.1 hypothetical protein [Verrucomicrobiota bacterium]
MDFLSENWELIAWGVPGVWVVITLTILWMIPRIDFRIGSKAVVVECMGFALRRIPLVDIDRISKRLKGKPEVWRNTLKGNHRILVLYRKRGKRPVVITPHNRYIFRKQLEMILGRLPAKAD